MTTRGMVQHRASAAFGEAYREDSEERHALQREKHDAARELRRGNYPAWINAMVEGTEDPYSHLNRDAEEREYINGLLGRRA